MEEVQAAIGKPHGKMTVKGNVVWLYEKGTVEFQDDKVVASSLIDDATLAKRQAEKARLAAEQKEARLKSHTSQGRPVKTHPVPDKQTDVPLQATSRPAQTPPAPPADRVFAEGMTYFISCEAGQRLTAFEDGACLGAITITVAVNPSAPTGPFRVHYSLKSTDGQAGQRIYHLASGKIADGSMVLPEYGHAGGNARSQTTTMETLMTGRSLGSWHWDAITATDSKGLRTIGPLTVQIIGGTTGHTPISNTIELPVTILPAPKPHNSGEVWGTTSP